MFSKWRKRAFSDIILIVSGSLIVFVLPEFASLPAGCIFNKITGFYCAGCGISRGVHSLLRGDFYKAADQNLLLVTAFPLSVIWLTSRFLKLKYSENMKKYDTAVIIFFIIIVLLFMVLRNIQLPYFNFLRPD